VDNLFLDPQFVDQHPPPIISLEAALGDSPACLVCDPLPESHAYDGIAPNEPSMEFIVEGTPSPCSFMTLAELLAGGRELINPALQSIGHVHRTKADMPVPRLLDASDAPHRVIDRGGLAFLQW